MSIEVAFAFGALFGISGLTLGLWLSLLAMRGKR